MKVNQSRVDRRTEGANDSIVAVNNYTISEASAIDGSSAIVYNCTPIVIPLDSTICSMSMHEVESDKKIE